MFKDKVVLFIICLIITPFIYLYITMNLSDLLGDDTVRQLNYSIIIGILLWIAVKR